MFKPCNGQVSDQSDHWDYILTIDFIKRMSIKVEFCKCKIV